MSGILSWRIHAPLALLARLYLGTIFVIASWHKILHPEIFAVDVAAYEMLPVELINPMALLLPWIELVAGLMMIVGLKARAASLLISGMMVIFLIAVVSAWRRDLDMSCGCFASAAMQEDPISGWTVVRDTIWLNLSLYVLIFDRRPLGLDHLGQQRPSESKHEPPA